MDYQLEQLDFEFTDSSGEGSSDKVRIFLWLVVALAAVYMIGEWIAL